MSVFSRNQDLIALYNMELNVLRKIICLRNFVSVKKNSVCNVIKKLAEHGIQCLPCFDANASWISYHSN